MLAAQAPFVGSLVGSRAKTADGQAASDNLTASYCEPLVALPLDQASLNPADLPTLLTLPPSNLWPTANPLVRLGSKLCW